MTVCPNCVLETPERTFCVRCAQRLAGAPGSHFHAASHEHGLPPSIGSTMLLLRQYAERHRGHDLGFVAPALYAIAANPTSGASSAQIDGGEPLVARPRRAEPRPEHGHA